LQPVKLISLRGPLRVNAYEAAGVSDRCELLTYMPHRKWTQILESSRTEFAFDSQTSCEKRSDDKKNDLFKGVLISGILHLIRRVDAQL
jgi:hypothetical protein